MKNYQSRPYVLAEINWKTVKSTKYDVAILPWGATEAHNYHLPYSTDNYQVEAIGEVAVKYAWGQNCKPILLPNIPFGVQTGQMDINLCMNILPSTQLAILKDTCEVLKRAEINKLIILNGHGGNDFKTMIRELSFYFPGIFVSAVNWFKAVPKKEYFEILDGDHADEMESSLMLYLQPNLVNNIKETGDGATKEWAFNGIKEGWATAQRQWSKISEDTGAGAPYFATAEKGEKYFKAVVKKVGEYIFQVAKADLNDLYE